MECDAKWDDIKTITTTYRKYNEKYLDAYPSEQIFKINFKSPEDITNYLIKHALSNGYFQGPVYERKTIVKDDVTYYIFTCTRKTCDSILEYRRRGAMLYLEKAINKHSHKMKITPKKAKTHEIRQYLMDLPAEDNIEHHIENVKNTFKLSKQQAKYIKSKLFWRFENDDDLL